MAKHRREGNTNFKAHIIPFKRRGRRKDSGNMNRQDKKSKGWGKQGVLSSRWERPSEHLASPDANRAFKGWGKKGRKRLRFWSGAQSHW